MRENIKRRCIEFFNDKMENARVDVDRSSLNRGLLIVPTLFDHAFIDMPNLIFATGNLNLFLPCIDIQRKLLGCLFDFYLNKKHKPIPSL